MRCFVALAFLVLLETLASGQTPPTRPIPPPSPTSSGLPHHVEPGGLAYLIENPEGCLGEYRLRSVSVSGLVPWEVGGAAVVALALYDERAKVSLEPSETAPVLVIVPDSSIMGAAMEYRSYWSYSTELVLWVARSDADRYIAVVRGLLWRDRHGGYLASTYQYLAPRPGEGGGRSGIYGDADGEDGEYFIDSSGRLYRRPRHRPGTDVPVTSYYRRDGTFVRSHTRARPGEAEPD